MLINSLLSEELDLVYWKRKGEPDSTEPPSHNLNDEELNLLVNILKAINIKFDKANLSLLDENNVYSLPSSDLVFDDVETQDQGRTIHLSSISDMIQSPELKKKTWFKLKNKFL